MAKQVERKLIRLEALLPEGLLVDAAWLARHGYSTSLRSQYLASGWLKQPARQVYTRPRGALNWEQAVISLQTLLGLPLVGGGRTALELQGFAHYLAQETKQVHLYGPKHPPGWLSKLSLGVRFVYHNSRRLFHAAPMRTRPASAERTSVPEGRAGLSGGAVVAQPWGQSGWQITLSSPERAVLELLDELPNHESFHQVDKLVEGLANLSPRRLQKLLRDCRSVKVKRLFFYFADRHQHAWLHRIDKSEIDLGRGKRLLARGGAFNATYQITVPENLDAVR
jgi:hypothetical protein